MHARRGIGLGTTLMVSALVVTLGFALSGLSVSQLARATQRERNGQAENLADSVASLAVAKLLENPGAPLTTLRAPGPEGEGLLTFVEGQGLPLSCNNLEGLRSKTDAHGYVVPAGSAHLVAEGRVAGTVRRVEVILSQPPFPYALACEGTLNSKSRLVVAGIKSSEDAAAILRGDLTHSVPADLVSNGRAARALVLAGEALISGNLQSAGGIITDHPELVKVLGEVRPHRDPVAIPTIDFHDYDPADPTNPKPHTKMTQPPGRNPTLGGIVRRQGNLTIQGDLTLDSGLLYVDGNLTVTGGVRGKGAIVVTGNATVQSASALDSGNRLALLAQGDLSLQGNSAQSSYLQGVVYSGGNFTADEVTLIGSLITHGGPESTVDLNGCALLPSAQYSSIDVSSPSAVGSRYWIAAEDTVTMTTVVLAGTLARESDTVVRFTLNDGRMVVIDTNRPNDASLDFSTLLESYSSTLTNPIWKLGGTDTTSVTTGPLPNDQYGKVSGLPAVDIRTVLKDIQDTAPGSGNSPTSQKGDVFHLAPSELLKIQEKVRISLWRDL